MTPVPRAAIDAARRLRDRGDITELLADAIQRGLCPVSAMSSELASCGRRGSGTPRSVLAEVSEGVRSAAERDAKQLLPTAGLPEPWWNAKVYDERDRLLGIADCWWDDVAMAWEIESTEWHLSPSDHDRSVAKAARFGAAGVVYIPTKPKVLRSDPAGVRQTLRQAHGNAAARPRPPLRAERAPST